MVKPGVTAVSAVIAFAVLVSAAEPSFSAYVRKFAVDIAAGDDSVTTWNNLGVALINRGNELPRQGGAQTAYAQARNALHKALSRARGMKPEDVLPGQGADDVMANIETLQSECEAHAGRSAAQALRSTPPRAFDYDTMRPLLALDVDDSLSTRDDGGTGSYGDVDGGENDGNGHADAVADAEAEADADADTGGNVERDADGDGSNGGNGGGGNGDGGSDDEEKADNAGAVSAETEFEFEDVVPWPESRASRRDSSGLSPRSRALVSLINCEKDDCVVGARKNEELFRIFHRPRAVELVDAELTYLENKFGASGGNNTYISDVHIKANHVTLVKLWLSMGNRRLAVSAVWTFFLNATLVTICCAALYQLGAFVTRVCHRLHRLLLRGQHLRATASAPARLDSFDGLRAVLIGQTVFGHYASWWRCVGNFAHTIEYRSATLRLFGLQPVVRFVFMPLAFINMVHLSVSATFTMAGFVVAWPLFPLRHTGRRLDDNAPDVVPQPLLTVRSTLQWSLGFYAAKLRRIWLPFISILLIVFALNRGVPEQLSFREFVVNNALFMAEAKDPWYFRPGLWSLVPYVHFLLVAPILLFFAARRPRLLLAVVGGSCFIVRVLYRPKMRHCAIHEVEHDRCFSLTQNGGVHELVSNSPVFISPDSIIGRLDDFVSGVVACVLLHRGAMRSAAAMMTAGMSSYLSGCVLFNMSMLGMHTNAYAHAFANVLLWIGTSLVLSSLARSQVEGTGLCPVNSLLRWPLMRHIGSLQYAIYFVHQAYYHEVYYVLGSSTQSEPGRAPHPNPPAEGATAWHAVLAATPVLAKVYALSFCVEFVWRRVFSGSKKKHTMAAHLTREKEARAAGGEANHHAESNSKSEAHNNASCKAGKND